MALEKSIVGLTGHADAYWRVIATAVDAIAGHCTVVLGGYADADARLAGRPPASRRDWELTGAQYWAVAGVSLLDDLRSAGHLVDAWPAEVRAVLSAENRYNVQARAAYQVAVSFRRPVGPGTIEREDGSLQLPSGELIAVHDVDKPDPENALTWSVPSEFADAVMS